MARMIDGEMLKNAIQHWIDTQSEFVDVNTCNVVLKTIDLLLSEAPPNEWVSVEERLPDAEKEVRLFCVTPNGYKYQCQGFYVPPGMHRNDSDYFWDWECCEQYDEDSDDYFVNPGWYERGHNWDDYSAFEIMDKVTHWMPLPAPPGEDNKVHTKAPNEPLKQRDIENMVGKPVYLKSDKPSDNGWRVIELIFRDFSNCIKSYVRFTDGDCFLLSELNEKYSLYRRPPEGEEDSK